MYTDVQSYVVDWVTHLAELSHGTEQKWLVMMYRLCRGLWVVVDGVGVQCKSVYIILVVPILRNSHRTIYNRAPFQELLVPILLNIHRTIYNHAPFTQTTALQTNHAPPAPHRNYWSPSYGTQAEPKLIKFIEPVEKIVEIEKWLCEFFVSSLFIYSTHFDCVANKSVALLYIESVYTNS